MPTASIGVAIAPAAAPPLDPPPVHLCVCVFKGESVRAHKSEGENFRAKGREGGRIEGRERARAREREWKE